VERGVSYSVRVEGVRFSAAHFATFAGECEPLHGHSYEVAAEVEGGLAPESWVLDFGALRRLLRDLCEELDHRFILQADSRELRIESSGTSWRIHTPAQVAYLFPASDVAALPIDNSTAERLAEYLGGRLWEALDGPQHANLTRVSVEVWEGPGQRARFSRERLPLE
jgi:6-pyruvoyltetrahydropterin/6-carboxytetrahydropterin synthase